MGREKVERGKLKVEREYFLLKTLCFSFGFPTPLEWTVCVLSIEYGVLTTEPKEREVSTEYGTENEML